MLATAGSSSELLERFQDQPRSTLILEDGSNWSGIQFGANVPVSGEVVFNTSMVGYPEALTDPSYKGQILILTYPLIGNYGVPPMDRDEAGILEHFESEKIHIAGLIVCEYAWEHSHFRAVQSLSNWMKSQNIPGLYRVDTRAITKQLREKGVCLGKIIPEGVLPSTVPFHDPNVDNLVDLVTIKEPRIYNPTGKWAESDIVNVIAYDCGMKNNILRCLLKRGARVKVVPYNHPIADEEFEGVFVSNGPGNPSNCLETITNIQLALKKDKPFFGICLGHQLLALSIGAKTKKLRYGNRGVNQPCVNTRTGACHITSQNHGFAVVTGTLPSEWEQLFKNNNDQSNEGIIHKTKPFMGVQFHPEAMSGPWDTEYLFDIFLNKVRETKITGKLTAYTLPSIPRPVRIKPHTVLVLGSGGLQIGQAGEFDYSGSQCIKALKEEGIRTVLINPNIATVQTSDGLADKVYFLPLTVEFVTQVIKQERPDGIMLSFGGQTALNCGIQLDEAGILASYGVKVLGTSIATIKATEDRDIFNQKLAEINEKTAPGLAATTVQEAVEFAQKIGYPVIARAAYALGGLGSGFAKNEEELRALADQAFVYSPQILIEKSLKGWKELEYEVVRDGADNCIVVCNMENIDPMGVHTGESMVVAPSQTLTDKEYMMLRDTAVRVIRHLGIIGECNIQYALDPQSEQYYIIEVNARLSRSSALASKATGYPLAFVAAKLALGIELPNIRNSITRVTAACFEPSLDYIVCKIPRWDLKKFQNVSRLVGSAMKSVGEVMAIGRTFEEAFQKAIRMVDTDHVGFSPSVEGAGVADRESLIKDIEAQLVNPTDSRVFAWANALANGISVDRIYELCKVDKWFLQRMNRIVQMHQALRDLRPAARASGTALFNSTNNELLHEAKRLGFSDRQIGDALGWPESAVRKIRQSFKIIPVVKQIDTLAAEFPAFTNYMYVTYNGIDNDISLTNHDNNHSVLVLGSGNYRIGSSVEFDWCSVKTVRALKKLGQAAIIINNNPETVSTDYDESDRLYFEELSLERVLDIYEFENPRGMILSVGGQIPNNLAMLLQTYHARILGTSPNSIDMAENREAFSSLLKQLQIQQPQWSEFTKVENAREFCNSVGFPCIVRPSYVLSGAAMRVAYSAEELDSFLQAAADVSGEYPVVISKFIEGATEADVDAVCNNDTLVAYAISEHIENAGVHSGDAHMMLPDQSLTIEAKRKMREITTKIATALKIQGPVNVQFMVRDCEVYVIECNLRASRTLPFISKTLNFDFLQAATEVMMGRTVAPAKIDYQGYNYVCIKAPVFSFHRLIGADPVVGVEMASTGEVATYGRHKYDAFLKSVVASNKTLPSTAKAILVHCSSPQQLKVTIKNIQILQSLGYTIFITDSLSAAAAKYGVKVDILNVDEAIQHLAAGKFDLVADIENRFVQDRMYDLRRVAVDRSAFLITNAQIFTFLANGLKWRSTNELTYEPYGEVIENHMI